MIKDFLIITVIFFLTDILFLHLMRNKFKNMIKDIKKSDLKMKIIPTIVCYMILVSSIYYFIIYKNGTYLDAFLLGFFIYGVYETTNMAIFEKWNIYIGLIDMSWGGVLFISSFYFYNLAKKKIFN